MNDNKTLEYLTPIHEIMTMVTNTFDEVPNNSENIFLTFDAI